MARKSTQPVVNAYEQELYRGQFGFRNRAGHTGLDPWDTNMEIGRAEGVFLKRLFTLRLRTRNPLALLLMVIGAFWIALPLSLVIAEYVTQARPNDSVLFAILLGMPSIEMFSYQVVCLGIPLLNGVGGILLLVNVALSIKDILTSPPEPDKDDPLDEEELD